MEVIRRNVRGLWKEIPVSNEDCKKIFEKTLTTNTKLMTHLKNNSLTAGFTDAERIAVFQTLARHYHFNVERFVDEKINNESKK